MPAFAAVVLLFLRARDARHGCERQRRNRRHTRLRYRSVTPASARFRQQRHAEMRAMSAVYALMF